ncbi:MAG: SDR family oxidoreductase [Bdellovibrionota bacterium]
MKLENKYVLITGASSGIGKSLAIEFHSRGANLILVARRKDRLEDLCKELNSIRDKSASYYLSDLSGEISSDLNLDSLIAELKSTRIDILVNNAGRGSFGYFHEQQLDREIQMTALNIIAPLKMTHAVVPQMLERQTGGIINISSIGGFQPLPFMSTYSGTKAFNFAFSMSLRHELASHGVRVLTVCPGPVATEFGEASNVPDGTAPFADKSSVVAREIVDALLANKAWIISGFWSRLIGLPCRLLPKTLSTWLVAKTQRARV